MADSLFSTASTAAAGSLLTVFGVDAVYTPGAGSSIGLRVWFNRDVRFQVEGSDGVTELQGKTVECVKSDLGGKDTKGSFLIGGISYEIVEIVQDDGYRLLFRVK